jgi:hypothetical protein
MVRYHRVCQPESLGFAGGKRKRRTSGPEQTAQSKTSRKGLMSLRLLRIMSTPTNTALAASHAAASRPSARSDS